MDDKCILPYKTEANAHIYQKEGGQQRRMDRERGTGGQGDRSLVPLRSPSEGQGPVSRMKICWNDE